MLNLISVLRFVLALTSAVSMFAGDVDAQTAPEPCRGQGGTITNESTHAMEVQLVARRGIPCYGQLNGIFRPRLARAPSHGDVVFEGSRFTFRPAQDYEGPDLFEFITNEFPVPVRFIVRVTIVR